MDGDTYGKGTSHLSRCDGVRNNDPNDSTYLTGDDNPDASANGCLDDDIRYCDGIADDSWTGDNDAKDFYSSGHFDSASYNCGSDHDRRTGLRVWFSGDDSDQCHDTSNN